MVATIHMFVVMAKTAKTLIRPTALGPKRRNGTAAVTMVVFVILFCGSESENAVKCNKRAPAGHELGLSKVILDVLSRNLPL